MPAPVTGGGLSACSTPPRSLQHNDNDNNPPLKMDRPSKRAKTGDSEDIEDPNAAGNGLRSLHRSITPPPCSRQQSQPAAIPSPSQKSESCPTPETICSPISLTHIRDLPGSSANNVETVQLRDLLGDPMIRECWQFNYLFDVDYLMEQFDEDVRDLVIVKVVHGSWKREASNRIRIDEACAKYANVEPIIAFMPEPFGTHHSKMMILLRHDDLAQVVIHTANMIPGDWANMCQAVWRSPLLPLQRGPDVPGSNRTHGTGSRFKHDLLEYLNAYGRAKTNSLVKQLAQFDFSAVRAALIASVPSKQPVDSKTRWGWPALRDILQHVPVGTDSHIVVQISSVATLGQTDKWLKEVFFKTLASSNTPVSNSTGPDQPKYSIIFPTPDEIRRSLNGYGSGGSIHMKTQSAPQQKQLQYMKPYLRQWAGDSSTDLPSPGIQKHDAGRRRAAPHIKTYIRFNDKLDTIDWAMLTSANLSTQAWGAAVNAQNEVRICSWEIGVLVWPGLFTSDDDAKPSVKMVPCFKRDYPKDTRSTTDVVVGFRMPYDLPLTPYTAHDEPWCATATYTEPDWLGRTWEGYE